MPPSDQEPRYQLVDSNGNVVGSLFGDGSGNVVIADETDTQTTFDADGITTPALEAGQLSEGVAGTGNTIQAVAGGSQKFEYFQTIPIGSGSSFSVSSTTFVGIGKLINIPLDTVTSRKNVESKVYVGVSGRIDAPSGETATMRFRGNAATERVATDNIVQVFARASELAQNTDGDVNNAKIEAKTTGGTAVFDRLSVTFAERIQ